MSKATPTIEERLAVLKARAEKLNGQIWTIEKRQRSAAAEPLIGRCFRYRNSYSCPKDDSERWWLYRRVISMSASGRLIIFQFQTDRHGEVRIQPGQTVVGHESIGEPITLRRYQRAWGALMAKLGTAARKSQAMHG